MHSAPIALLATNNKFVQGPPRTNTTKKMNSPMGMPDTWRQIASERKQAEESARAMSTSNISDNTSSTYSEDLKANIPSSKPSKMSKLKSMLKGSDEQKQSTPSDEKPLWKNILTGEVYKHHPMYRLEQSYYAQSLQAQVQPKSF